MDAAQFKATVTKFGGVQNIIAIVFDNASRKVFLNLNFTYADNWDDALECFLFKETDVTGNEYLNVKHVENTQSILFATDKTKRTELDSRLMSS
jgi:hypothetical protein